MAASGEVVRGCLDLLAATVRPGMTTKELDAIAEEYIREPWRHPDLQGLPGLSRPPSVRRPTTWWSTGSPARPA